MWFKTRCSALIHAGGEIFAQCMGAMTTEHHEEFG